MSDDNHTVLVSCPHCSERVPKRGLEAHGRECPENDGGPTACHDCGRPAGTGGSWTRVRVGDNIFWRCPDCNPG